MKPVEHDPDPGISLLALFCTHLGQPPIPGTCQDCYGLGRIPDITESERVNYAIWKTCPTCLGRRQGGTA